MLQCGSSSGEPRPGWAPISGPGRALLRFCCMQCGQVSHDEQMLQGSNNGFYPLMHRPAKAKLEAMEFMRRCACSHCGASSFSR
jgi:hypothetical protein